MSKHSIQNNVNGKNFIKPFMQKHLNILLDLYSAFAQVALKIVSVIDVLCFDFRNLGLLTTIS